LVSSIAPMGSAIGDSAGLPRSRSGVAITVARAAPQDFAPPHRQLKARSLALALKAASQQRTEISLECRSVKAMASHELRVCRLDVAILTRQLGCVTPQLQATSVCRQRPECVLATIAEDFWCLTCVRNSLGLDTEESLFQLPLGLRSIEHNECARLGQSPCSCLSLRPLLGLGLHLRWTSSQFLCRHSRHPL